MRSCISKCNHRDGVSKGENRHSPLWWPSANSLRAGHTNKIYREPHPQKFASSLASGIFSLKIAFSVYCKGGAERKDTGTGEGVGEGKLFC
jgi:hypothetical protein